MKYLFIFIQKSMFALMLAMSLLSAASAQLNETTAQAVKHTVQAQLAAFAKDDADLAFSYAAPTIRAMFETPQNFMAMVQDAYPVVYRPERFLFLASSGTDSAVVLPVKMWDKEGQSWMATYKLELQADGRWLIVACVLVRDQANLNIIKADQIKLIAIHKAL
jgi:hypothetical protein